MEETSPSWENLPLAELKLGTKGVKAQAGEEEKMRTSGVSIVSFDGSATKDLYCTLTTQRLLLSNTIETRYFAVSSISDVDAVGKKSKISKMMGKKQAYKLVIKTGTMGEWTLVFADAFPGSIQKPDTERNAWAQGIIDVSTQQ